MADAIRRRGSLDECRMPGAFPVEAEAFQHDVRDPAFTNRPGAQLVDTWQESVVPLAQTGLRALRQGTATAKQTLHVALHQGGKYNHLKCALVGAGTGLALAAIPGASGVAAGVALGSAGLGAISVVLSAMETPRLMLEDNFADTPLMKLADGLPGAQAAFALAPLALVGPVGTLSCAVAASATLMTLGLQHLSRHKPQDSSWAQAGVAAAALSSNVIVAPMGWLCVAGTAPLIATGVGLLAASAVGAAICLGSLAWRTQMHSFSTAFADQRLIDRAEVQRHHLDIDGHRAPTVFNVPPVLAERLAGLKDRVQVNAIGVPSIKGGLPIISLDGPPGAGKTTMAKGIANYLDADLIQTSAARLESPYMEGGPGGHLRLLTLLWQAEVRSQIQKRLQVVFVDEIASMFAAVTSKRGNREANQEMGNMLLAFGLGYLNRGATGVVFMTADNHTAHLADTMIFLSPRPPVKVPALGRYDMEALAEIKLQELLNQFCSDADGEIHRGRQATAHAELARGLAAVATDGRHLHLLTKNIGVHAELAHAYAQNNVEGSLAPGELYRHGMELVQRLRSQQIAIREVKDREAGLVPRVPSNRRSKTMTWMQDLAANPTALTRSIFAAEVKGLTPAQALISQRTLGAYGDAFGAMALLSNSKLADLINLLDGEEPAWDRIDTLLLIPEAMGVMFAAIMDKSDRVESYQDEYGQDKHASFFESAARMYRGEQNTHPLSLLFRDQDTSDLSRYRARHMI